MRYPVIILAIGEEMSAEARERADGGRESHRRSSGIIEIALLLVLPLLLHYLIPIRIVIPPPYSYTGAIVMVGGLGLMVWAARAFQRAGTGFRLEEGGSALVTSGPFRFSRNPMYLGIVIWLIGFAILLGSLVVFVLPVIIFLLAQFMLIPIEEKRMEQTFGKEYVDYKSRVRRWL
jgi:protein-S-isoprenylcysteine O-methyltransferase Ste14